MNYIGSKAAMLGPIARLVAPSGRGRGLVFADAFAGSGVVARRMKRLGFRVLANDLLASAAILNRATLERSTPPSFAGVRRALGERLAPHRGLFRDPAREVCSYLSHLPGISGFVTRSYSPEGGRFYFTRENARRIDAVRREISTWAAAGAVTDFEGCYLTAALLEAADSVANTASVYASYLKAAKPSALAPLAVRPLASVAGPTGCTATRGDATEFVASTKADVTYLDPPYAAREYGAYYHVLETIALGDEPDLRGKVGMRDTPRSRFCSVRTAEAAFEEIVSKVGGRRLVVSYSDEGLIAPARIFAILATRGAVAYTVTQHSRYQADTARTYARDATREYLFAVSLDARRPLRARLGAGTGSRRGPVQEATDTERMTL